MTDARRSSARSVLLVTLVLLAGCDSDGTSRTERKGGIGFPYDKHCIEGVIYIKMDRGISVQLDRDGKVVPCGR